MGDLWVAILHKPDVLRCAVGVLPGNYYCYVYHGDARRHLVSLPNLSHFSSQQRGQLRLNICHTHLNQNACAVQNHLWWEEKETKIAQVNRTHLRLVAFECRSSEDT